MLLEYRHHRFIMSPLTLKLIKIVHSQTQPIQGAQPTLVQCWSTVYDAGPPLNQHRETTRVVFARNIHTEWILGGDTDRLARVANTGFILSRNSEFVLGVLLEVV